MPARTHEYEPGTQYGCWTVVREVAPVQKSWGLQRMVIARCHCGFEGDILPKMLQRAGSHCRKCKPGRPREVFYNPGDTFGNWTVVKEVDPVTTKGGWVMRGILAACICGDEHIVTRGQLHKSKSCRKCTRTAIISDGDRFGSLVVIQSELPKAQRTALVRCDCGVEREVAPVHLVTQVVQSCGCRKHRAGSANPQWKGFGRISGAKWKSYRNGAKLRGLSFNITLKQVWDLFEAQSGTCALTGVSIDFRSAPGGETTASLDRIDSSKGYTIDNVQWVHKDINKMKQAFSESRFLELCQAVVDHAANRNRLAAK